MKIWWLRSLNTPLIWYPSGTNAEPKYSGCDRSEGLMIKWTDINDIAIELVDNHPDVDPQYVNFVDLRQWVLEIEGFSDDPERCGEKILEAIQMAWIEEQD
jgi:FeS assembly protein IscX